MTFFLGAVPSWHVKKSGRQAAPKPQQAPNCLGHSDFLEGFSHSKTTNPKRLFCFFRVFFVVRGGENPYAQKESFMSLASSLNIFPDGFGGIYSM